MMDPTMINRRTELNSTLLYNLCRLNHLQSESSFQDGRASTNSGIMESHLADVVVIPTASGSSSTVRKRATVSYFEQHYSQCFYAVDVRSNLQVNRTTCLWMGGSLVFRCLPSGNAQSWYLKFEWQQRI